MGGLTTSPNLEVFGCVLPSLQKLINHANDVAANDLEQAGQGGQQIV